MKDNILKVLSDISNWNQMTKKPKNAWEVVPEFCYVTKRHETSYETIFVKEVMDFVRQNGTVNKMQSAEEAGALGQGYVIDSAKLLSHFGCELVKK